MKNTFKKVAKEYGLSEIEDNGAMVRATRAEVPESKTGFSSVDEAESFIPGEVLRERDNAMCEAQRTLGNPSSTLKEVLAAKKIVSRAHELYRNASYDVDSRDRFYIQRAGEITNTEGNLNRLIMARQYEELSLFEDKERKEYEQHYQKTVENGFPRNPYLEAAIETSKRRRATDWTYIFLQNLKERLFGKPEEAVGVAA